MDKNNTLSRYDLPLALRTFWDTAPGKFRLAAVVTAATCYCALATRIRARYVYDLEEHALLLQVIILGEAGSGKSFTRPIVRQIMQPLKDMDSRQRRIETEYYEKRRRISRNKDLPPEPLTSVRCLQTITKAKLVKRADMFARLYHEPMAFWFFNEELATMTDSNKRAFADLNTMDRLAYDVGALYGSDALCDASYNAEVDVIYCSLFCGTNNALNEYIGKQAVEGGNCTRKVLVRIDDDAIGDDAPVFRRQSDEERTLVEDTAQRLMDETYTPDGNGIRPQMHLDMQWMDDSVRQWCDQQRVRVVKSGSRALNCFYKRASVSAWRMAVMAYHLWCGEQGVSDLAYDHFGQPDGQTVLFGDNLEAADKAEEECLRRRRKAQVHTARFYRYMADYILRGLLRQWGQRYEDLQRETEEEGTTDRRTIFDQLPPRFTRDQLRLLITQNRLNTPARVFISKWKRMRLIRLEKDDPEIFAKHDAPEDDGTTPAG